MMSWLQLSGSTFCKDPATPNFGAVDPPNCSDRTLVAKSLDRLCKSPFRSLGSSAIPLFSFDLSYRPFTGRSFLQIGIQPFSFQEQGS